MWVGGCDWVRKGVGACDWVFVTVKSTFMGGYSFLEDIYGWM